MWSLTNLIVVFSSTITFAQSVVPTQTLKPGQLVTARDVRVVEDVQTGAFTDVSKVIGLEVQRVLYRGRPFQVGDIGAPALVERNEIVTLIYQTTLLSIATEGRALGRGAEGAKLRVINIASRNTVVGHVNHAGEVIVNQGRGYR
ncbi:MAG: flagellar basal body P-ring formation chaperone FlgA [Litoreibacter sp.]|uniref:flagellar basal body P-ring formation chaperone FlgA n=1 Tax=Litoreibacter sp. TaxID=1969459 RepID=UPI003297027B